MHLPREMQAGSSGPCDARIGRYCYWYDSTPAPVVAEPKQITEARARLVIFLDSAAAINPADGWIAGQRTRYLLEARRLGDAVDGARRCHADRWWCAALGGLALHVSERYAEAESAYAVALTEMPAPQRCEWLDLQLLVDDRAARELSRATCEERARLAERLWALSKPLWSTPGNDLRTEHFARLTMANILARTANAHGMAWGDDSRELLVRYGWAEWYTRSEFVPLTNASSTVTGHDREPSFSFFPVAPTLHPIPRLTGGSWQIRAPRARTRYAPRHLNGLGTLSHQLVRFPRGDSTLLAVAFRVRDTLLARDSIVAVLGTYGDSMLRMSAAAREVLWMTVPIDTLVASIEVRGANSKRAERARYTVDPLPCRGNWCVSDLLLFGPAAGDSNPDASRALATAVTEQRFSNRKALGVLWEVRRNGGSAPAWLSLTVAPVKVSAIRRLATRLHLAPEPAPIRLRWQATLHESLERQSVTLHLPGSARGKYRLLLTVEPRDAPALSAAREIELVP